MRPLLIPLSWLYGGAVALRNLAFDSGIFRQVDVGRPVISVGNLTAGGTGKTPLVEILVRGLAARGTDVCILSRGYGRRTKGVVLVSDHGTLQATAAEGGDEPVQLARSIQAASVVVGERRVDAARRALSDLKPDLFVLDDGFQHRAIRRTLNILVLDARHDITREPMLPAGLRREPVRGIRRADIVVFSRVANDNGRVPWEHELVRWFDGPVVAFAVAPAGIVDIRTGAPLELAALRKRRVLAFSAIGDNAQFVQTLESLGAEVVRSHGFRDHYRFRANDIRRVTEQAQQEHVDALVTTEKDLARFQDEPAVYAAVTGTVPALALRVSARVVRGEAELWRTIEGLA